MTDGSEEGGLVVHDPKRGRTFRKRIPRRMRLFAQYYAASGNLARSAISAGYSEAGASGTGARLLRIPAVRDLVAAQSVDRSVHAEKTYQNLILVADAALKEASEVCGWKAEQIKDPDPMARARALEVAGRALERLAKAEGLMIEKPQGEKGDDRIHDLLELAQKFAPQLRNAVRKTPEVIASIPPKIVDAEVVKGNGSNGHKGNGEGHHVSEGESPPPVGSG